MAGGLLLAAALPLLRLPVLAELVPPALPTGAHGLLGAVFVLRAVGDFTFVGFGKRIRSTRFATFDTYLYSPLCLLLAALSFCLAVGKP